MMIDDSMMKLLAESMARSAAQEIMLEMREEIAVQFETMKSEMKGEILQKFTNHFGQMASDTHVIHHNRISSWIAWADDFQSKMWTRLVMTGIMLIFTSSVVVTIAGYFIPKLLGK